MMELSGNTGDVVKIKVWAYLEKKISSGKTGIILQLSDSQNKEKTSKVFISNPNPPTWKQYVLKIKAKKPFQLAKVILFNSNSSARYFIDDIQLTLNTKSTELTSPSDLSPEEMQDFE